MERGGTGGPGDHSRSLIRTPIALGTRAIREAGGTPHCYAQFPAGTGKKVALQEEACGIEDRAFSNSGGICGRSRLFAGRSGEFGKVGILLLSAFRFEDITHCAARNRFAFHGITSEDDFGF